MIVRLPSWNVFPLFLFGCWRVIHFFRRRFIGWALIIIWQAATCATAVCWYKPQMCHYFILFIPKYTICHKAAVLMKMLLTPSESSHISNILFEHSWIMEPEKVDENQIITNFLPIFFFLFGIRDLYGVKLIHFWFCPQGGIHGKISLTAYVVAALLETGITTEVSSPTKWH